MQFIQPEHFGKLAANHLMCFYCVFFKRWSIKRNLIQKQKLEGHSNICLTGCCSSIQKVL